MSGVVPDLEGLELVGEGAEAVLVGGCDETVEPNQVFRYMNLARAFAEIQLGAELYCLHKNRWWQTSRGPLLDAGAFVAGLEYATGVEAVVLGKPSPAYFAAALDALGAEPERTWLVGDDPESDVRGAHLFGMHTALVRTGKFRPEGVGRNFPVRTSAVRMPKSWAPRMSASGSSVTSHVRSGSAPSASRAAAKYAGLGLPSTIASTPVAYSSPATNAPASSMGPRLVCHQRFLWRQ